MSKEINIGQIISQETEIKEPSLQAEPETEINETDFAEEPFFAEEEEEPETNSFDDDDDDDEPFQQEQVDFDTMAGLTVMALDLASTFGFTNGLEKKLKKDLSQEQKLLFSQFQYTPPEDLTKLNEDEQAAYSAVRKFNKTSQLIPLEDFEREELTVKTARVLSRYNIKVTPEIALLGSCAMIFGSRFKHVL